MKWFQGSIGLMAVMLASVHLATAGEAASSSLPSQAPARTELKDQYNVAQALVFPAPKRILLTVADRKGSDQIDGWIQGLKGRYSDKVDFRGLADCGGAPGFVHGMIRKKFQEVRKYPVMLDWSGKVCSQVGYKKGVANVLLIDRDGSIRARFTGEASETGLRDASAELDRLTQTPASAATPAKSP